MSVASEKTVRSSGGAVIDQAGELRSARMESLRAIGVLSVVVVHTYSWVYYYGSDNVEGFFHRVIASGTQAGPFLLFVASACLLYGPFARRDLGRGDPINLRRYAVNRVLRILPLYYAVLVVLFVFQERGGTPVEWVIFATFSQNFSASTIGEVNRVMWYMVIEVHFYVLLPFLALLLARAGSRGRASLLLGMLGSASFVYFMYAWHLDPTPSLVWQYSLPSTFFFLAAGMMLALLRLTWEERRPGWLRGPLASADAWIAASAGLWVLSIIGKYSLPSMTAMAVILLISVLLVGACVLPLRPGPLIRALEWRPLAVIGIASYSLYLWHDPILKALANSPLVPSGSVGLLLVGLPLCCLVALASYALIEAPFLTLRRRWARSTPRRSKIKAGKWDWSATVPRTTALTAAALAGALAAGMLFAALDPPVQTDKTGVGGAIEGRVLAPEEKPGPDEAPLPGMEDDN